MRQSSDIRYCTHIERVPFNKTCRILTNLRNSRPSSDIFNPRNMQKSRTSKPCLWYNKYYAQKLPQNLVSVPARHQRRSHQVSIPLIWGHFKSLAALWVILLIRTWPQDEPFTRADRQRESQSYFAQWILENIRAKIWWSHRKSITYD